MSMSLSWLNVTSLICVDWTYKSATVAGQKLGSDSNAEMYVCVILGHTKESEPVAEQHCWTQVVY